jgi:hypothetical protein
MPCVRYWWHPESDSLWITDDGEQVESDGFVEELTADEHARLVQREFE